MSAEVSRPVKRSQLRQSDSCGLRQYTAIRPVCRGLVSGTEPTTRDRSYRLLSDPARARGNPRPQFWMHVKGEYRYWTATDFEFVPNRRKNAVPGGFFSLMNFGIFPGIVSKKYDAQLVHGYEHFAKWAAFAAGAEKRDEAGVPRRVSSGRARRIAKRASRHVVLRSLFSQFERVSYFGTMNRR